MVYEGDIETCGKKTSRTSVKTAAPPPGFPPPPPPQLSSALPPPHLTAPRRRAFFFLLTPRLLRPLQPVYQRGDRRELTCGGPGPGAESRGPTTPPRGQRIN